MQHYALLFSFLPIEAAYSRQWTHAAVRKFPGFDGCNLLGLNLKAHSVFVTNPG